MPRVNASFDNTNGDAGSDKPSSNGTKYGNENENGNEEKEEKGDSSTGLETSSVPYENDTSLHSTSNIGDDTAEKDETATTETSADSSSPYLFLGYPPFSVWRVAFYLLMAYHWNILLHGPWGGTWSDCFTYDHAEWVYDMTGPRTTEDTEKLRWLGTAVALISTVHNGSTILFAVLTAQHVFVNIMNFINHDYLFFLLSTLMAFYCNCEKDNARGKTGWIHAIRGQIVVVYFYASLWKIDIDWRSGQIVKDIFLSFEEQGVNRGVPWAALYEAFPSIFQVIGLSGLLLDTSLFLVLMLKPPGHWMQSLGFVFHGFIGYTMSQRIGYSFPCSMLLTGLVFKPHSIIDSHQKEALGLGDTLSHFQWLTQSCRSLGNMKKMALPLLFLLVQWLLPLRMPIISRGESKYTFEGYRWSWTMMLHGKVTLHSRGITLMTIRPKCETYPFPNPHADQMPFSDVHGYPYERHIVKSERGSALAMMFPRQMPKIANAIHTSTTLSNACDGELSMTTSYFASTNKGPFHRIIDPTVDLLDVYKSHKESTWSSKLWHAMIDKGLPGKELLLRGTGSIDIPITDHDPDKSNEITVVDRSACLQIDPIRIHLNSFYIEFDTKKDFRLLLMGCSDIHLSNCVQRYIAKGEKFFVPSIRTVSIGIDHRKDLGPVNCSKTVQEDVFISLTELKSELDQ